MQQSQQVAVLGGGIIGICCALNLRQRGFEVTLIDRDEPGQGASMGNAGVISPWSVTPQSMPGLWRKIPAWLLKSDGPVAVKARYLPRLLPWTLRFLRCGGESRVRQISGVMRQLNDDNVNRYKELLKDTQAESLIQDSYYVHAFRNAGDARLDSLDYQLRVQIGAELECLDTNGLRELEPGIAPEFSAAIVIKNQGRCLSPGLMSAALTDKFRQSGGEILGADIRGIERSGDNWVVITSQGNHSFDTAIVTLGAWSNTLLRRIHQPAPLEAERGYHVEFDTTDTELNNSVMDMDLKLVASSMHSGLRIAGTAEFAGLDQPVNPRRLNGLIRAARRMLPGLSGLTPKTWMGHRPSSPDSLPYIGAVPGAQNLYAAFGHGHYGLMMAPRSGEIVADLVAGAQPDLDITPLRLDRFR